MKNYELEEKVSQAFSHITPDILDAVLSDSQISKGQVNIMRKENRRQPWTWLAGLAACLMLVLGGTFGFRTYRIDHTVDATVSLDVNPSVEIQVNRKERVLAVNALNEDGAIIIGDMDLSGSDLNVAVNALVGSMLQNGYINELSNSILISVDSNDPAQGAVLQETLAAEVNTLLQSDTFSGAVLSQTIASNDDLQKLADAYGITLGKAQLIQEILNNKSTCTFEDLAPLTINELNLLRSGKTEGTVESVGTASDKAYIGQEAVRQIVLEHAGVSAGSVTWWELELDSEHGVMVYEVEFYADGYEYEYEVNAQTGVIVKTEKKPDEHASNVTESTTQTPDTSTGSQEVDAASSATKAQESSGGSTGGTTQTPTTSTGITEARAKEIALAHAGVSAGNVTKYEIELDTEKGVTVYEIEFKSGGFEYEYEVNASTGDIIKSEKEWDD
jgi:uncharacterized membrane protein YkoI